MQAALDAPTIRQALDDVGSETDPMLKHLKLASLVAAVFRERQVELVVVGGSAIEFYTEGGYVSGDLDLCLAAPVLLSARERQELMGRLGARGGPRNWEVGGVFVDLLGAVETLAEKPFRELRAPYGPVRLLCPEELLVERVLVSVYPERYEPAVQCARKLAAVALRGQVEMDWAAVRRLAARPEYDILPELEQLLSDVAHELGKLQPGDSQGPAD